MDPGTRYRKARRPRHLRHRFEDGWTKRDRRAHYTPPREWPWAVGTIVVIVLLALATYATKR